MKVGFTKDSITINSKKFDPLNILIGDHGLESDFSEDEVNPFELIEKLASVAEQENKIEKLKVLQSIAEEDSNKRPHPGFSKRD
ncbi:hypothetical protein [Halothermothrix orenii]|uniref:hypothetical protein n=1 Tax=Halothermothrix orenii TaxID=31909 RepID=UPI0002E5446C|nr:hypothetical protein [Halothermothrix orenii]